MFNLFNKKPNEIAIECPLCGTEKSVLKSKISNFEKRKVLRCKCTCGCSFHKRIEKKDPKKIDLISAIAQMDFGVLWFKLMHPLAFFNR